MYQTFFTPIDVVYSFFPKPDPSTDSTTVQFGCAASAAPPHHPTVQLWMPFQTKKITFAFNNIILLHGIIRLVRRVLVN